MSKNFDITSIASTLAGLSQAEMELVLQRLLNQKEKAEMVGPTHRKEVNGSTVLLSTIVGVKSEEVNGQATLVPCELGDKAQVGRFVLIYGHGFQGDGNGGYRLEHLDNYQYSRFEAKEGTTERTRVVQKKDMSWVIGGCVLLIDLSFGVGGPAVSAIIPALVGNAKSINNGIVGHSVSFDAKMAGFQNDDIKPVLEGLIGRVWGYAENPVGDAESLETAKSAVARINRFGVSADRAATSRQVMGKDGKLTLMAAPVQKTNQAAQRGGATALGADQLSALAAAKQAGMIARAAQAGNG